MAILRYLAFFALLCATSTASPIIQEGLDEVVPETEFPQPQAPHGEHEAAVDVNQHYPLDLWKKQSGTKQWHEGMYWDKAWGKIPTDPSLHQPFAIRNDGSYATYKTWRMAYAHHREETPSCSPTHVQTEVRLQAWAAKMHARKSSRSVPKWAQSAGLMGVNDWSKKPINSHAAPNYGVIRDYCGTSCKNWMVCIRHNVQAGSTGQDCAGCPRRCFVCECMNPVAKLGFEPPKTGLFSCPMTPYDTANFCPQNCVGFSACKSKGVPGPQAKYKSCEVYPRRCVQCECLAKGYPSDFSEGHKKHLKFRKQYCPECVKKGFHIPKYKDPSRHKSYGEENRELRRASYRHYSRVSALELKDDMNLNDPASNE